VMALFTAMVGALASSFRTRAGLVAENLALRQQLAVLRVGRRPRLRPVDRAFWVVVSRVWSRWVEVLAIVKPATVVGWHRRGSARFWTAKSRRPGRPPLAPEIIELIARMAHENPTWSRRRIAAELAKLGHDVSKDSVAKYMPRPVGRPRRPPSTTWGTFVRMHLTGTIAVDFLTVPTVTFRTLYVFVVLSLERRVLLHVNVTAHPHAAWQRSKWWRPSPCVRVVAPSARHGAFVSPTSYALASWNKHPPATCRCSKQSVFWAFLDRPSCIE
jgi:putative transposase